MSPGVSIRPKAEQDTQETLDYIEQDNPDAAIRFLIAARQTCDQLLNMPGLGRLREYLNPRLADLRSWRVSGFERWLIFYRATDEGIEIIRILHGARDLEALLAEETS